jgi:hypothetical protein
MITEKLLLSFRGQTIEFVRKVMKAPGRDIEHGLRFLSNYGRGQKTGSGDVNVTFEDGQATIISASVDTPRSGGAVRVCLERIRPATSRRGV